MIKKENIGDWDEKQVIEFPKDSGKYFVCDSDEYQYVGLIINKKQVFKA